MIDVAHRRVCFWNYLLVLIFICGLISNVTASSWPYEEETKEQRDARMAWWREARFGMFIHWGVYAVPAGTYKGHEVKSLGEWIMNFGKIPVAEYKPYAKDFNPVKYDPDAWVRLAKEAGMKYIIITSKHHDGFALFDSKVTDWDVVDATPYGKDLLKPLAEACRKHGIKLGFYYSQAQDWCHPGGSAWRRLAKKGWDNPDAEKIDAFSEENGGHWDPAQLGDMDEYIKNISIPQIKEIFTNYGDVAVLWWDTPIDMTQERADMMQPLINLQPGIITNNRLGGGYPGDTKTPENRIPANGYKDQDWETCMTMNHSWGYKSFDHDWKSTEKLLTNLVDIASKGGNLLLNVGPTAEGEIPQPSIDRLKAIGKWMSVNGESIYGTTASPFPKKLSWGRCTKKTFINGAILYLHVFERPDDGKIVLPGLKNEIVQAYLLTDYETNLETASTEKGATVTLPEKLSDPVDTVVVLRVAGPLTVEKDIITQDSEGTVVLPVAAAEIHNAKNAAAAKLESYEGKTNIGYWTDSRSWVEWEFVVKKEGAFTVLAEAATPSQNAYEVHCNGQKKVAHIKSTGSYRNYRSLAIAEIGPLEPGEYTLELKPFKDQWNAVNLRSISLKLNESQAGGTLVPAANQLPPMKPLIDMPFRDTYILAGPDGIYYMTGTTGHPNWWMWNKGIQLYKSTDLVNWELMDQAGDDDGLIWNIETEGTWANKWKLKRRAVWAPEIHYIKGTYWLTYCVDWHGLGGTGLLKSTTGLPEGPYVDVKPEAPLTSKIDASLFQDDDGKVYFIWQEGRIWQMNEQMDGFVGNWKWLQSLDKYSEGGFIRKMNGRYYLGNTSHTGRYDFALASSDSLMGPYSKRYIAIPYAGHTTLFSDAKGQLYSTFFGADKTAPLRERAAFLPVKIDENGCLVQKFDDIAAKAVYSWRYRTTAPSSKWTTLEFDDTDWTQGTGGFGLISAPFSVPRTHWDSSDIWMRRKFELDSSWKPSKNLALQVYHTGDAEIYLNNRLVAELKKASSGYIQVDLEPSASQALSIGTNVLSVHCAKGASENYVDVGLVF